MHVIHIMNTQIDRYMGDYEFHKVIITNDIRLIVIFIFMRLTNSRKDLMTRQYTPFSFDVQEMTNTFRTDVDGDDMDINELYERYVGHIPNGDNNTNYWDLDLDGDLTPPLLHFLAAKNGAVGRFLKRDGDGAIACLIQSYIW